VSANIAEAVDKIRDEMATTKTNGAAIRAVGEIMTALLEAHPDWAGAVLKKGKTLKGAYGAMEHYAREHKEGSCYYMPPETAESVICKYYGVGEEGSRQEATGNSQDAGEAGETTAETTGESADANYGVPTGNELPQSAALTAPSEREPDESGEAQTSAAADPFDLDALLGGL